MSIGAGDLLEVRFNNADAGNGTFFYKSGEEASMDRGGFRNEDPLGMSGDGQAIVKKNRMPWSLSGTIVWDRTTATLQQLVNLAQSNQDTVFTFFGINGSIDTATGTVVGDIIGSYQDATVPIKLSGGGLIDPVN